MEKKNIIVGQSGGPTAAINATLAGVISAALHADEIDTVYGMRNGIEGLLCGDVIKLNGYFDAPGSIERLKLTPASALGSCRKKLPCADSGGDIFERIISALRSLDVSCFFYIGGNDSMDTVSKMTAYAQKNGIDDISFIGVPKTIDNDLVCTDHTPGFGSAAKYLAVSVSEMVRDCAVYTVPAVTIIEIMGRDAGWLTAAAGLCDGVDCMYFPEIPFDNDRFFADIEKAFKKHPNVVVAVSEGIKYSDGGYVGASGQSGVKDVFGHKYLSGTGKTLERMVKEKFSCKARSVEVNILQRCASHMLSRTDISESFDIGSYAVSLALAGKTGVMPCFVRKEHGYDISYESEDVTLIANKIKTLPREYINGGGNGITQECADYLRPLIEGELYPEYKNGLPVHFIFE